MCAARQRDVQVDVALDENAAQVTVTVTREVAELFDEDGELRLWEDDAGWAGYPQEIGRFFRVNTRWDGDDWLSKQPVQERTVQEGIRRHIRDPKAGSKGVFRRGVLAAMSAEEIDEVLERTCQPVPDITVEDVLEHSVCHEPGGGSYASGVGFRPGRVGPGNSRKFLLLDKDGDGVAEYAFSYGAGPERCMQDALVGKAHPVGRSPDG